MRKAWRPFARTMNPYAYCSIHLVYLVAWLICQGGEPLTRRVRVIE